MSSSESSTSDSGEELDDKGARASHRKPQSIYGVALRRPRWSANSPPRDDADRGAASPDAPVNNEAVGANGPDEFYSPDR